MSRSAADNPDSAPITTPAGSSDHIAGIDGLRGIAALTVFFLHTGRWLARGGDIGVDVFFVISGFVITRSLLREYNFTHGINIAAFYVRRMVRLWPALLALTLVTWLFFPTQTTFVDEVLPSLFYYANWSRAFGGGPWILAPTWTLALEEQFYLIWPLLFWCCLRLKAPTLWIVLGLALASAIWRGVLFMQGHDIDELLFRFDTKCDALFLGVALALVGPLQMKQLARLFWFAAAYLAICMVLPIKTLSWSYLGGTTLVAISAVIVLAKIVSYPNSRTVAVLEWAPLKNLGKISYAFYLWHFLVLYQLLAHSKLKTVAGFAISLGCAILSWYLIERPAKRFLLPRWAKAPAADRQSFHRSGLHPNLSPPSSGA